jgi:hypothetical protein
VSIRDSFVERFGEDLAVKIEEASIGHINDDKTNHGDDNWGSDPFRYHLMMAIAHECMGRWGKWHGIDVDVVDVMLWTRENADLLSFDGDQPDYIAMIAGCYYAWIDWEKTDIKPPDGWEDFEVHHQRWQMMTAEEQRAELKSLAERAMQMLNDHGFYEGPSTEGTV